MHREQLETLYAANADEALKLLGQRSVDVVIVDEHMPGLSGNQLLGRIRDKWPNIVRMMLTGDSRAETVIAGVNNGEISRFFLKPANETDIINQIKAALKRRATAGVLNRPAPLPR
jgi:DNA-binding response OmpR family regulator